MNEENTTAAEEQFSLALIASVVQDVLRRWYMIVAVALIAAMVTFVVTDLTYTPRYTTSTTFVATAGGATATTYQNLAAAKSLASVFGEVVNSSLLRSKVLEATGLGRFDGTITAAASAETNLLTMTVSGSDPRSVFLMTRGIIEHHGLVTEQVLGSTVLEVLREPTVPVSPSNPLDVRDRVVKAAFCAAAAMALLLAVLSWYSDKIRSQAEADSKLSCRVLGELYHERKNRTLRDYLRRRKRSILITDPITSFVYAEAVGKLASRIRRHLRRGEKVLMVTSLLENEGKSTVAVNLALALVRKGKKVLLIDCDLRRPACGLILNAPQGTQGVAEVLQGKARIEDCVLQPGSSGLYLLPGRKSLRTATDLVGSPAMEELLRLAAANFDYVVVDTPPMSLAPDAECLSELTDASLLVVQQNEALAADLNTAAAILDKAKAHFLGCTLNNVRGSGSFTPAFNYGSYGTYGKYGYSKRGYGYYGRNTAGTEKKGGTDAL